MQVLAQLLVQPGSAAALARLTWALGPGLGEYLLQQVGWVLQDADTLLGHHSLRSVLKRRFGGLLTPEQLVRLPPTSTTSQTRASLGPELLTPVRTLTIFSV